MNENYTESDIANDQTTQINPKIYTIIAAVIVFGIIFIVGQIFKKDINKFVDKQNNKAYPKPAQMPPALKISVEDAVAKLDKALAVYGKKHNLQMAPGLSSDKIATLAKKNNIKIPEEISAFFSLHNGSRKNDSALECFLTFEESLDKISKLRKISDKSMKSGDFTQMGIVGMIRFQKNWLHIYDNSSYYFLAADLSRKPAEGAYFFAGSTMQGYYFFPSLQNALSALSECFEKKAFILIDKIDKPKGIFNRNAMLTEEKPKQLLVNTKTVRDIMTKYGTWQKADQLLLH